MSRQIVEIETKTFIRFWLVILGIGLILFLIVKASQALAIIGVAALLAIAIRPLALKVDQLIGKKTESKLASVLAYIIVLLIIAAVVAAIAPVIITEFAKFISTFPETVKNADLTALNDIAKSIGIENFSAQIVESIEEFSKTILSSFGTGVVSGISLLGGIIGKAAVTLILTLFFLLDGPALMESFWSKLGAKRTKNDLKEEKDPDVRAKTEARVIVRKMSHVISTFFAKQVTVAIMDGCFTAISVLILSWIFGIGAHLAIPMGLITMVFYLIPMFGQVIGGGIVTLLLAFNNPLMAILWLAIYVIYAAIEVNGIAPKIQGNALNLRPVIILIAMIIGTYMFGLFGAIIAIPIAGCIKVLIEEYPTIRTIRA